MKPPRLAIVTSMSKGMTLYTHIHLRKDKFNINKTTVIAQQISQVYFYITFDILIHFNVTFYLGNGISSCSWYNS